MPISVVWLAFTLALFTTANSLVLLVTVIVGAQLAGDPAYATIPLIAQYIGLISASIPIAHLMMKYGRRAGFILGNIGGLIGGVTAIYGIYCHDITIFSIGIFFTGVAIGIAQQYRFAALDEAPTAMRSKAIGLVMSGGIVAALVGPTLAVSTRTLFANIPFLGTFVALLCLYLIALPILLFLPLKNIKADTLQEKRIKRTYRQLYSQPLLILIAIVSAVGYALVVYMVSALPLAMKQYGFEFPSIALVFQCHVLGMFAPSFITGQLINRLGVKVIIYTGVICLIFASTLNLFGHRYAHFLISMILLGIGWNFILISSTHLLPRTYADHEKGKIQGATDFLIFGFGALGSLFAGILFHSIGWYYFNSIGLIVALLVLVALFALGNRLSNKVS